MLPNESVNNSVQIAGRLIIAECRVDHEFRLNIYLVAFFNFELALFISLDLVQ